MNPRRALAGAALLLTMVVRADAAMVFEGETGPVTANEVAQFRSYVQSLALPTTIGTTDLAYGTTGTRVEAMGYMYRMTRDKAILDVMLKFTDRYLSCRNDPVTGTFDWTGQRELIWLPEENRSGAEQGIIASKLSLAALLILETPSLWGQTVASGDPHGYGATYRQRADRYIAEMDKTEDTFLLKWFVRASDNRYFFPTDPRYDYNRPGRPAPHNQGWMFSFNKMRLARCHEILGNASRAARYRQIVQANLDWYTSEFHAATYGGFPSYLWYYDETTNVEDIGHAQIGVQAMLMADILGGYTNLPDRVRIGNAFRYAVYKPATDQWSGEVNGTGTLRSDMLPSYVVLSRFVPSLYSIIAADQVSAGKIANDAETVAYLLWAKQARFTGSWTNPTWPAGTATPTATATATATATNATPTATPTATATATPTPRATPTPVGTLSGYYKILARHSGKAVVVQSASTSDGADVIQWTYGGAATNDEWRFTSLGGGYYRIDARHSGKAMVVQSASSSEGADVIQWTYGGTNTNDEWQVVDLGGGYFRLNGRMSGKALEVTGASTADGADVVQRTYSGGTHQQFEVVAVP
jgi:hypothetical protein